MNSFVFDEVEKSWPKWFQQYIKEGKVAIGFDHEEAGFYTVEYGSEIPIPYAYLWTPDKVVTAEEGTLIVNRGSYCTIENEEE